MTIGASRRLPALRSAWTAGAAALILVFVLAAAFALYPVPAEQALFRRAAALGAPFGPVLIPVTRIGNFIVLGPLALLVAAWLLWSGRARDAVWLVATCLAVRLATAGLKLVFLRPRPDLLPQLDQVHSASFPSAHAANSAATFLAIAIVIGGRRALGAAIVLALAIGTSRILLAVHWPSDIIGGWALGAFSVLVAGRVLPDRSAAR